MSLAVSSGVGAGAAAGGGMAVAMAHQPHVMTQHIQAPQGANNSSGAGRGAGAPRSASGLAADVVDKNITAKQIRNSRHMPIVCMDLYGDGEIAYVAAEGAAKDPNDNLFALGTVGGSKSDLVVKRNDEGAYKALRKLLSKGEKGEGYYDRAISASIATTMEDTDSVASIVRPHLLLGARRISQLHPHTLAHYPHSPEDLKPINKKASLVSAAIQQFDDTSSQTGVAIRNQSLDGSSPPSGVDFDRVALQLDLMPKKKKPLTILPDEAVGILLAKARSMVQADAQVRFPDESKEREDNNNDGEEEKDVEEYLNYPMAIAVPGWHTMDASVESHLEAILGSGSEGMVYHRTVAALAGALLPRGDAKNPNKLMATIYQTNAAKTKALQEKEKKGKEPSPEETSAEARNPLVIAIGMTKDGIEGMACLTSKFQNSQQAFVGSIQSLTEISIQHEDPISQTEYVLEEIMEESILKLLPKSNQVPCAIMTFGSNSSQEKLKAAVKKVLKTKEEEWGFSSGGVEGNQNVPILSTREEAVAMGACLLAAGSHGRITDGSGQKVTVSVSNVSSCAVGVRLVYFSDDEDDVDTDNDDNIKVLFDFDRRLPATPYTLELKAAECAAIRARGKDNPVPADEHLSEEEVNKFTGGRMIPVREEAAHAFKLQIVQKSERDGKWISVGDVIEPLHLKEDGEEGTVAIEEAHLQISVGPSGLIMTETYSDRYVLMMTS